MQTLIHNAVELVGGQYNATITKWQVIEETTTHYKGFSPATPHSFAQEHLFSKEMKEKVAFDKELLGFTYYTITDDIANLSLRYLETEVYALNALFDNPEYETGEYFNKKFFDACDNRLTTITI